MPRHPRTRAIALWVLLALPAAAWAQQPPALPPPAATDPAALGLMQGFPPPPDKTVTPANILLRPAFTRWGYQHMRELGPTAAVKREPGEPSALPVALRDLDGLRFGDGRGGTATLAEWQRATYTDALLVLHQGRVVHERYDAGMKADTPHFLASMSKSLTGLLATLLIHDGRLDPQARIAQYLPELADSAWGDATLQQTLDMTAGVRYDEDFSNPRSGVFQYLIAGGLVSAPSGYAGPKTVYELLAALPKEGEHGAGFQYRSVHTEVVGWVLQRVTGTPLAELLSQRLWRPLGAADEASVWIGPAAAQLGSVGVSATARDLARLGEALRQRGRLGGRQVLPAAVVDQIRQGGDRALFKAAGQTAREGYSYHNFWWIPHDADGSFEAKGLNGQHLHVNPAAELVIVKFSTHPAGNTLATHVQDRAAFAAIAAALRANPGRAP